jgi:hypothetical protein
MLAQSNRRAILADSAMITSSARASNARRATLGGKRKALRPLSPFVTVAT